MEKVRQTPSEWGAGTEWLEVHHTETLLDHMDWEGEITEVKCSSTFVK
jgi:hypothetical protein